MFIVQCSLICISCVLAEGYIGTQTVAYIHLGGNINTFSFKTEENEYTLWESKDTNSK